MIKKILKWIFLMLLFIFIVIQFIRPAKNKSEGISKNDISTRYAIPANVQSILKTSCYDCHSNNTVYPWYAQVQPVAWWLDNHIRDGKKDLNFSEFASYSIRRQYKKLEEVNELVKENEMPLESYLWIHTDAKLDDQQKLALSTWVNAVRDSIKANNPPDSLKIRKK
ncbi:MAG TPA: heme-binding domain-containing protein [Ferruginibacter sp.]|jgi:hypothetical protein|nr:heme-binding domain-containing protein [Ferruginibacter sp.]